MDNYKKSKMNNIIIMTQESENLLTNSPNIMDFKNKKDRKRKDIEIKSNYEIGFESERSSIYSQEKHFKTNMSNEQENIENDLNNKIKELLIDNKILLEDTIKMKEKVNSQEIKIGKLMEKEQLYKKQLEVNKKKVEQCDLYQNQLKERENYINELISRYNALEKEYQQIVSNKNSEIKDLNNRINLEVLNCEKLQNQVNYLTESSNNITKDLTKDINILEDKNRELENKLSQAESYYNQEINNLNKHLGMIDIPSHENKSINSNLKPNSLESISNVENKNNINFLRNSSETVVEINTQSHDNQDYTKKTGDFFVDRNNYDKDQRIEDRNTMKIRYENEKHFPGMIHQNDKLTHELKNEKENVEKVHHNFIDQKYFITKKNKENQMNSSRISKEDIGIQTQLKNEDIDLIKKKLSETENYLIEINENNEILINNFNKIKEENILFEKENQKLNQQIDILIKKHEKSNKANDKYSKEFLNNVSKMSNLNSTISGLKLRNQEMEERLDIYENQSYLITKKQSSIISDIGNLNLDKNENNYNLPSNKNVYNKKNFKSFQTDNLPKKLERNPIKRALTFRNEFFSPNFYDQLEITNTDVLEYHEPKKIRDDNIFLKEQNFKNITDLQKQSDEINNLKINLKNIENENKNYIIEKEEIEKKCLSLQNEALQKNLNMNTIEELKKKLITFSEINSKLNENFFTMEEKVNSQNKKIIDKNALIIEKERIIESLQNEKQLMIKEKNTLTENIRKYEKELETVRSQNTSEFKEESFLNKIKHLKTENKKLYDKLKQKKKTISELYDEIKQKDDKLKAFLQEKNDKYSTLIEEKEQLSSNLTNLKKESENLIKENNRIKVQLDEKNLEISKIIDQRNRFTRNENKNTLKHSTSFDNALTKHVTYTIDNSAQNDKKKIRIIQHNPTYWNDNDDEMKEQILNLQNDLLIKKGKNNDSKELKKKLKLEINEKEKLLHKFNDQSIEKNKLLDKISKLEESIYKQSGEMSQLRSQTTNFDTIQKQINEMNINQEKVNQIFNELGKIKEENKKKIDNLEHTNSDLLKKIKKCEKDNDYLSKNTEQIIEKLKNENFNLHSIIKNKDHEIENITNDKSSILEKNNINKNEIKSEIYKIREDYELDVKNLSVNNDKILEKITRNKNRLEMLTRIHENHINFLNDRFKQHVTDLIHAINSLKIGNKYNTDSTLLNDRFGKNIETFTTLLNDISQREATIEYYKNENKSLKNSMTNLNNQVKSITKDNNDLKEQIKNKKLQHKILEKKENNEDYDFIQKLKDYVLIIQENSCIKQNETKLKIKIQSKESEIKLLKCQLDNYFDQANALESELTTKDLEIKLKEKETVDVIKSNKNDINRIMDELSKIKEKWVSPERFSEKLETISNLEKIIKSLKEDIERKKDLLNHYKNGGNNEEINNKFISFQEKIKESNADIIKKDKTINFMKNQIDEIEINNRKLLLENSSLHNQVQSYKSELNSRELFKSERLDNSDANQINYKNSELNKKCENLFQENEQLRQQVEDNNQRILIKYEQSEKFIDILKKIYIDLTTQYDFIFQQNPEKTFCKEWNEIFNLIENSSLYETFKIAEIFIKLKEKIIFNNKIYLQKGNHFISNEINSQSGKSNNSYYRDYQVSKIDKK